jgi:hypothetical protein
MQTPVPIFAGQIDRQLQYYEKARPIIGRLPLPGDQSWVQMISQRWTQ